MCYLFAIVAVLCFGVKESSLVNNIFTFVNLFVVAYVVIVGLFKADFHNWNLPRPKPAPAGEVNFLLFVFQF